MLEKKMVEDIRSSIYGHMTCSLLPLVDYATQS